MNAGGFVIQIDGQGVIYIRPKPTDPVLVFDNSESGMLMNGISFTADMSDIPNRYIVIDDVNITVAENNDVESVVSIPSRGYKVDEVDTSPTPVNGETYSRYANRRLHELSVMHEVYEYTREYAPDVYPYSVIRATISELNGDDMRVNSQSITCGHGITVSEKLIREVQLYD